MTAAVQDFEAPALDFTEPVKATDERAVVFYTRITNFRLVRRPTVYGYAGGSGQRFVAQQPVVVDFGEQGRIVVKAGDSGGVDSDRWLADTELLEDRGLPTGAGPRDLVTALRSHRGLNEQFFEEGREPGRPLPTESDFIEAVTIAATELNTDRLRELLVQEEGTHKRPLLVTVAKRALEKVEQAEKALEAKAAGAS